MSHAYLGQLDVDPVGHVPGSKGTLKHCEFWAKAGAGGNGPVRLRIEGKSEAAGVPDDSQGVGDARLWQHEVKLTWQGIIEMKKDRMIRLLLVARGSEKLKWGNKFQQLKDQADVTMLLAGHAVDLNCGVRYGIIGEPIADEAASDTATADPADPAMEVPDEARRQLVDALGTPFILFRDKVQKELKLTDQQKKKVDELMKKTGQETKQFFQTLQETKEDKRPKEMQEYRQKAHEKLAEFVNKTLKEDQRKRLRQIELQHDGLFALLGNAEVAKELEITDKQRQQFAEVAQAFQKKVRAADQGGQERRQPAGDRAEDQEDPQGTGGTNRGPPE